MATDTYEKLRTAVSLWLQRDDLDAQVPYFIEFATNRFNRELRTPEMEAVASTTATAEFTALPDDFLSLRAIESDGRRLEYVPPEEFLRHVTAGTTPDPPVYSITDMQFRMHPAPTALPVEVLYFARVDELVNNGDTNWLLTKHPDLYLFASLVEAAGFLQDDPRISVWDARLQQAMSLVNRRARQMSQGAATMIMKAR